MLARSDPVRAADLARLAQEDVDARRRLYEQMAEVDRGGGHEEDDDGPTGPGAGDDQEVDPT